MHVCIKRVHATTSKPAWHLRGVTRWSVVLLREPEEGRPKDRDLRILRPPLVVAIGAGCGLSSKRSRLSKLPWHRCMAVVATVGHIQACGPRPRDACSSVPDVCVRCAW